MAKDEEVGNMIIYKITNRINGKVYIGQTKQSLQKRWNNHCCKNSHCSILHSAIKKYGAENFTVEQIDVACSKEELDKKEIFWIAQFNSVAPNGYNISSGGNGNRGHKPTAETLAKRSASLKGIHMGDENPAKREDVRKKMSEAAKHRIGELSSRGKRVACIETGKVFPTAKEAGHHVGCTYKNISAVCNGKRKSCGGFHWKWLT
jgi:group I intron endonuclease